MNGLETHLQEAGSSHYVEIDPTGRYGRYDEILGKGASKTVYRGFDEQEGIEVAWNQVKLCNFFQCPEDLERLYSEIHLLKTLKHKNIMKFYTSWVDTANRNINFVTEMFTSGTLRQYRLKHRRVNIRAVKRWCRQILRGLLYLHSQDPPVIHRDLKCDNIFVNGNRGEIKIGDLGLAAILRQSHADRCVGTPEFMAPEVYEEAYNELVDIYAFGMCVLEMITFEYPYSECNHPVQIYKKVVSGKKPAALYEVKDPNMRQFVEKCLAPVSCRLSAKELLSDPFLQMDDRESKLKILNHVGELDNVGPLPKQPFIEYESSAGFQCNKPPDYRSEALSDWRCGTVETKPGGIELFEDAYDGDQLEDYENSIKGKIREDGSIVLRLRIVDKEGCIRNIYFPFDIKIDTALTVATEMIAELDITDQDVTEIADKIDGEIASLVPDWKIGCSIDEAPGISNNGVSQKNSSTSNHESNDHSMGIISNAAKESRVVDCTRNKRVSLRDHFEEIDVIKADNSTCHVVDGSLRVSSQSRCHDYELNTSDQEHRALSSQSLGRSHSERNYKIADESVTAIDDSRRKFFDIKAAAIAKASLKRLTGSRSLSTVPSYCEDKLASQIQWEIRWLWN